MISACGRSAKPSDAARKEAAAPPVKTAIDARLLNDAARFVAGLPGGPGSAYHALESTPAWAEYAEGFNKTWSDAEKEQLGPVRAFEARELKPSASGNSFLFYPFSGPDVLYATEFFPRSTLYVMAGLEPVGKLETPADYSADNLSPRLNGLATAVRSIFTRSFFVTGEMEKHFAGHAPVSPGILPVMLMLLARTDYVIDGIQFGGMSRDGVFEAQPLSQDKHEAVEIVFHSNAGGPRKTLYYASTDLGGKYDPRHGFGRFVALHGQHDTFVKSASFLLHWRPFLALHNQILETSTLILQDDTGIAFHELQHKPWQLKLYGKYSAPDKPFKKEFQKAMDVAFAEPGAARPLGFSIGYGYHRRTSSLILATRPPAPLTVAERLKDVSEKEPEN